MTQRKADLALFSALDTLSHEDINHRIRQALIKGANINARNNHGHTLLQTICCDYDIRYRDYVKHVKYLIKSGADVNALDNTGATAIFYGNFTRILLNAGANVNVEDKYSSSPLTYAARGVLNNARSEKMVYRLLENRADVNHCNKSNGMTPLLHAVNRFHINIKVVKFLLEAGADMSVKNKRGNNVHEIIVDKHKKVLDPKNYQWGQMTAFQVEDVMNLLHKAQKFYDKYNSKCSYVKLYEELPMFSTDLVHIITSYAVITIKDYLNDILLAFYIGKYEDL